MSRQAHQRASDVRAAADPTPASWPRRCGSDVCTAEGDCPSCGAAQGEACRMEDMLRQRVEGRP